MISVEKAKSLILEQVTPASPQWLSLEASSGLVLAESIQATLDVPAFDNSAMDGYAVRAQDLAFAQATQPVTLHHRGYVPAGFMETRALQEGECFQIATGAPIPPGADTVVMKEAVTHTDQQVIFTRPPESGENVRYRGEDISQGEAILAPGETLLAGQIALLAAFGYAQVPVYPPVRVAVLATGSELIDLGQPLSEGKIHDSNSYMLQTLLREELCSIQRLGIVGDDPLALSQALEPAQSAEMLLISGGVSVGEHDFVKSVLESAGVREIFWKVSIQPGKPFFFGKWGERLVFGLPGNPASSYVIFEEFVRPAIRKRMGRTLWERPLLPAELEEPIHKRSGRRQYLRAQLRREGGRYLVKAMPFQGSHSLRSLVGANALIVIPESSEAFPQGAIVNVRPLFHPEL